MQFLTCAGRRWQPGIGDPTLLGWMTTGGYLLAGVACAAASTTADGRRERLFWGLLALLMLVLAANKELDLQTGLNELGRCVALDQGWYGSRRAVQATFVVLMSWYVCVAGLLIVWAMRRSLKRVGLALLGLTAVFGYITLRAAVFNHVEPLMQTGGRTLQALPLLEILGLALIAGNAIAVWIVRR